MRKTAAGATRIVASVLLLAIAGDAGAQERQGGEGVYEGWCCLNGEVFPAPPVTCREEGGAFFTDPGQAQQHCRRTFTEGWCCLDGEVFPAPPVSCREEGGAFFTDPGQAQQHCRQTFTEGWCCLDGEIRRAAVVSCVERGGWYFKSREEAERTCRWSPWKGPWTGPWEGPWEGCQLGLVAAVTLAALFLLWRRSQRRRPKTHAVQAPVVPVVEVVSKPDPGFQQVEALGALPRLEIEVRLVSDPGEQETTPQGSPTITSGG